MPGASSTYWAGVWPYVNALQNFSNISSVARALRACLSRITLTSFAGTRSFAKLLLKALSLMSLALQ